MKVMIVEDSEPVRRMIVSFIGDLVEEIVECEDGSTAVSTYCEHSPDLVLMDIQMKKVDGFEATRGIKKAFPEARVFIVSQWDTVALHEAAEIAGADGYINKGNLLPLRDILKAAQIKP